MREVEKAKGKRCHGPASQTRLRQWKASGRPVETDTVTFRGAPAGRTELAHDSITQLRFLTCAPQKLQRGYTSRERKILCRVSSRFVDESGDDALLTHFWLLEKGAGTICGTDVGCGGSAQMHAHSRLLQRIHAPSGTFAFNCRRSYEFSGPRGTGCRLRRV